MENRRLGMRDSEAHPFLQIHCPVERDAVKPRGEGGVAAEGLDRVVRLQEHLLCHIFRFGHELTAKDRDGKAKYPSAVPINQFLERMLIAGLGEGDKLGITMHSKLMSNFCQQEMEGYESAPQECERQRGDPEAV